MTNRFSNWKKYTIEFLSIFIAVVSAFALNNWNDNRRDNHTENKILVEISNGLEKDLDDIDVNIKGHQIGISACKYFRKLFTNNDVSLDSLMPYYFQLTRDYICIQNIAGYETLKSRGLEIIDNDALRLQIISLYEYDYSMLKKFEEEYAEMQFHASYFEAINAELANNFTIDSLQNLSGLKRPIFIEENQKKKILLYLWKIETNRGFLLSHYAGVKTKISALREAIKQEI